jgi:hypothetical protein
MSIVKQVINVSRKLLLLLFFCFPVYGESPNLSAAVNLLRNNIKALDHAWQQADQDLQIKRQENTLAVREEQDYALFIDYLKLQITNYCQELVNNFGMSAASGLPCQQGTVGGISGNAGSPRLTTDEKTAALDSSLTEMLGEFDEMLLKEDERITTAMNQQRAAEAQGSVDSASESAAAGSGSNDQNQQQTAENQTGGEKQQKDTHVQAGGVSSLGDADDDIVARQLREAAEKESDPELKKKLWEEYQKYKRGG